VYDTISLYTQLIYYRDLFDIVRAVDRSYVDSDTKGRALDAIRARTSLFDDVSHHVREILQKNRYCNVDMSKIFCWPVTLNK